MLHRPLTCIKCEERLNQGERSLTMRHSMLSDPKCIHYECADFDARLVPESQGDFNSWHIQKLITENSNLNQKVNTLLRELIEMLRNQGATDQDIEDIRAEFTLYDKPS